MIENVAIFGASNFGKIVFEFLEEYTSNVKTQFFLDNNKNKNEFLNIKVYRPDEIDLHSIKILVASDYYDEIKRQLINMGLKENINFFSAAIIYCAKVDIDSCNLILDQFKENDLKYQIITRKDLKKIKSSNKLFIFGTGRSLNDLSEENIEYIRQHDSWVVTFGNIHSIVPTYSSYEFGGDNFVLFHKLTCNVKNRIGYPLTYIKDLHYYLESYACYLKDEFKKIPITKDIRLHTNTLESLYSSLHLLKYLKLDSLLSKMDFHLGGATSVTTVMFHALALGYKEVILCGVDLNKDVYFFEESMENVFDEQLAQYPLRKKDKAIIHSTVSGINTIPADQFIYMIEEMFFKDEGVSLKVASSESALYPKIGLYDFK